MIVVYVLWWLHWGIGIVLGLYEKHSGRLSRFWLLRLANSPMLVKLLQPLSRVPRLRTDRIL